METPPVAPAALSQVTPSFLHKCPNCKTEIRTFMQRGVVALDGNMKPEDALKQVSNNEAQTKNRVNFVVVVLAGEYQGILNRSMLAAAVGQNQLLAKVPMLEYVGVDLRKLVKDVQPLFKEQGRTVVFVENPLGKIIGAVTENDLAKRCSSVGQKKT